jgi:hypothetical protein
MTFLIFFKKYFKVCWREGAFQETLRAVGNLESSNPTTPRAPIFQILIYFVTF